MQRLGHTPQTDVSFVVFIFYANLAEYQVCYLANFSEGGLLKHEEEPGVDEKVLGFYATIFKLLKDRLKYIILKLLVENSAMQSLRGQDTGCVTRSTQVPFRAPGPLRSNVAPWLSPCAWWDRLSLPALN